MKFEKITTGVKNIATNAKLGAQKHSPEIFVALAIASGITTVVFAWRAGKKTEKALEEPKRIIAEAKGKRAHIVEAEEKGFEILPESQYTEEDMKHDVVIGYLKGAGEVAKLYAPVILMGAFSIACVLTSHRILSNRNAGLLAANGVLVKEFDDYRKKVVEKYGEEVDKELRFADKMEEVEEKKTDENGKEETVTTKKPKENYQLSDFARCFNEDSKYWQKDAMYNAMFLNRKMAEMTDRLVANRVLRLNDVYEALGFEKTQAGEQFGWVYDPNDDNKNYVDFGVGDLSQKSVRDFVFGENNAVWLDFNCSEIIYSKIPYKKV